ncbi:MAG: TIGR01440 family protein [Clostridia bacterium]|nr:TIGR01440 family protein [Clostridia bacterium]
MFEKERKQAYEAASELCDTAKLKPGQILVVGCSSSEICGNRIGSTSNLEAAMAVFDGIYTALNERGVYLAAQCCEHLNRAIVIERAAATNLDEVYAVPKPKAGGSFATAAYARLNDPAVVEEIRADAGLDIGDTFIGMHLKRVAVPVRLENKVIGSARVTAARTRPKYIGGERAVYDEKMK